MLETKTCPVCKSPCRVLRRRDGSADHYEYINEEERRFLPNPISPILAKYLRAKRKDKRTVAIVGAAATSGPWAPWGETDVWVQNEMHGAPWCEVDSVTGWFQLHPKFSFVKPHPYNHWEWLQEEHPFPIYMQQVYDDIPSSTPYPRREIQRKLIGNFIRGEEKMEKLFTSTMCYQVALALYEGYERIELYGIELLMDGEYTYQREAMAFWMGKADGMGVSVWIPDRCALLVQPLYAYEEVRQEGGQITWSGKDTLNADSKQPED